MKLQLSLALLVLPSLHAGAQPADEPVVVFPEIRVVASRLDPGAENTPGSTTHLDRDAIEQQNPISTAELLRGVAGVHVQESGGLAVVHLRGADPNLTLVLVDGVQMNDPTDSRGGAFDLGSIDPAEIESVQIVRGPASAVHGSDALAGVIEIRTRRRSGSWARLEAAEPLSLRLAAGSNLVGEGARAGAQFSVHEREDEAAEREVDGFAGAANAGLTRSWARLHADARYAQEDSRHFPQSSGGPELAVMRDREHEENESWQFALGATRPVFETAELAVDASLFDALRDVDSPGIWLDATTPLQPPSELRDEMQRSRFGLTLRARHGQIQTALGGELRLEDGTSQGEIEFVGPTDFARYRRIGSLFSEFLRQWERGLTLQAALRLDASRSELPQWSPRVSVQLQLPNEARLKSSYGRAFKLPSFYSLSHPLIGDAQLDAERSESVDVGVVQTFGRDVEIEFTWFHTRFDDLVDYDPTVAPFGRMVNRDEVTSQGFEAGLRAPLRFTSELSAHWSRAKTEVAETGDPLNERPEWQAVVALAHRRPAGHRFELRWRYVGAIPSFSYPTGASELEAYGRLDLNLLLAVTEQLRCSFSIENLTDAEYDEALGVPGPGILPRLGIHSDF